MVLLKSTSSLRDNYQRKGYGTVDDISHVFGVSSYMQYYGHMQATEDFIKNAFSNPLLSMLTPLRDALVGVNGYVYEHEYESHYNKGVDTGIAIVNRVNQVITWAGAEIQSKINNVMNWANGKINDINTIIKNQINPALLDAQNRLSSFTQQINAMTISVNTIKSEAQTALSNAKTALTNADSAVYYINNQIVPNLDTKTKQISDILNRLASLENREKANSALTNAIDAVKKEATKFF